MQCDSDLVIYNSNTSIKQKGVTTSNTLSGLSKKQKVDFIVLFILIFQPVRVAWRPFEVWFLNKSQYKPNSVRLYIFS